jgi:hypothetical protein
MYVCLVPVILLVHTTYEVGTERSETSAHKIQTPGNHPEERMQHSEHGESLKSRKILKFSIETEVSFARMVCIE